MKVFKKSLSILLLILFLGAFGFALYYILKHFIELFATLNKEIAAGIIAASGTVLVSVISVIAGKQLEKKREIENQHRTQKIEIYEYFMEKWFELLLKHKKSQVNQKMAKAFNDESKKFFEKFSRELILWGNHNVIKQYGILKNSGTDYDPQDPDKTPILLVFEKVLFAIRKDIGHSNKNLKPGDLITLFVTDPDNLRKYIGDGKSGGA